MPVDPIQLEVIQNRLAQIGHEAGIILVKTAASPTPVESKDIGLNLADHLGRTIVYSTWMPRHGTTLAFMLRSCIQAFGMEGIYPGDMFMVNDPHAGALHVSDIAIIAPIHYQDELVGWVGCATHHLDIGGMTPGWMPNARDWFQEGLKFSPIKIIERGQLREDIFNFFLNNVRIPSFQGHDLKAQIAANNFAKSKVCEMVKRYGIEQMKECYEEIINFSELKTRKRIESIPDGVYTHTDYMDFDKIYRLHCELTVSGDTMRFDFTGTSPQSTTFINAALPCSVANMHNIITCMLIPDIPANEGCFRPIQIDIPEGTVFSCRPPAPCSGSSVITGWKAQTMTIGVLTKALRHSPEAKRRVAGWGAGHTMLIISGQNRSGKTFICSSLGGNMQGGGGRATKDGPDVCNIAGSTNTSLPNVEDSERRYPLMFLRRGLCQDSEGPGQFRGGLAGDFVITPYGIEQLDLQAFHIGKVIPPMGVEGGYPGATGEIRLKTQTNVHQMLQQTIPDYHEIEGKEEILNNQNPTTTLGAGDVIYVRCPGGAGFGDPHDRDPEAVVRDLKDELISLAKAQRVYGYQSGKRGD